MADNCPFCRSNIENVAFLISPHFYVIYNHAPFLPGHSLVIPKAHLNSITAIPPDQYKELMAIGTSATEGLLSTFDAHAFNWALQEGEAAGQTVEHLHLHLLPRYQEDLPNPGDWYPKLEEHMASQHLDSGKRPKLTKEQQQDIVDKLRQEAQKKFGHYYLRDFSK
jgi:bis(5'-adenosyl)-triphosphatase